MQKKIMRGLIYLMGMVILAFGITLNTKTGLGVSPIISIAYCVSEILDWNFGNGWSRTGSCVVSCDFVETDDAAFRSGTGAFGKDE